MKNLLRSGLLLLIASSLSIACNSNSNKLSEEKTDSISSKTTAKTSTAETTTGCD